ncbi:MAG: hypothetical protein V4628_16730 [Pseudomonadota bacterium]
MKNLCLKMLMSTLLIFAAAPLIATVLEELTLEQLVADSKLIFEGKVLDVVVNTQDELVYSTVLFEVAKVHKGDGLVSDQVELRFLGGSDTSLIVEVEGQYVPAVGEHGLYFVTDPDNYQVNPLTGWGQGYFPVFTGEDGNAYLDLRNHPHYAFLDQGENPLMKKMQGMNFSKDAISAKFPKSEQFPLDDFLAAVQSLLEE